MPSPTSLPPSSYRRRFLAGMLLLACIAADARVLTHFWRKNPISDGQFQRGYFEPLDHEIALVMDDAIHPDMVPTFFGDALGQLGISPGMTAVMPLSPGVEYDLTTESTRPAYIVLGTAAAMPDSSTAGMDSSESTRLIGTKTLEIAEGTLVLSPWRPEVPWREDGTRLDSIRRNCTESSDPHPKLRIASNEGHVTIEFGNCTVTQALPTRDAAPPKVAALAGPGWIHVGRHPSWTTSPHTDWDLLGAIGFKNIALAWSLGLSTAVAVATVLLSASYVLPAPATLTWPLTLILALIASAGKALWLLVRRLPEAFRRTAVGLIGSILVLGGIWIAWPQAAPEREEIHLRTEHHHRAACTVVGYSTVKGEGLRGERGGIQTLLDRECSPCLENAADVSAGGENLGWARDNFCRTEPWVGSSGYVTFLGGVNDDFFWSSMSIPRLIVSDQLGDESWRQGVVVAAAASRGQIDKQLEALRGLAQCAKDRGARFLFLHDFLVTDLLAGREPDRKAMADARRAAVESSGGSFVNLLDSFKDEAGVSWFNDYVHFSLIGHRHVAALACHELSRVRD